MTEGVWNSADERFAGGKPVPDSRRAAEHLAAAGRAAAAAFPAWLDRATGQLPADGYAGACESAGGAAEVGSAWNDPAGHRDRPARRGCDGGRRSAAGWWRGHRPAGGPADEADRGAVAGRWCGAARRTALSDTPEWAEYWNPLAA